MTTTTQIDNLIVVAEKSQTYGTQRVFSDLFGIRFTSGRYLYTRRIRKQRVAILYMDLSEMRVNGAYAEWCCNEQLRAYRNLLRVICFEYCNPRMQEVENNIRQLRSLVDIDYVVFLFYLDSNITNNERERKLGILKQMNNFYECKYLENLSERVFILDQRRRLRLDSILPTWFAREESSSTSTQPLTNTSNKVIRQPAERTRDLERERELKRERERERVRKTYSSDKTVCALVFLALCFFFFICVLVIVLFLYNKAQPLKV